jgi:hypothetical protein
LASVNGAASPGRWQRRQCDLRRRDRFRRRDEAAVDRRFRNCDRFSREQLIEGVAEGMRFRGRQGAADAELVVDAAPVADAAFAIEQHDFRSPL